MTERVQLSRRKGWKMPENTVSVARPGPFGNPFVVGRDGTREECVSLFGFMIAGYLSLKFVPSVEEQKHCRNVILSRIGELRGKNLACWCKLDGKPCHADLLIKLANEDDPCSPSS